MPDESGDPLNLLVVDDEEWSRRELRGLLERLPNVEHVYLAADVATAADVVDRLAPDGVLLDVRLFGESGFDLMPLLPEGLPVVFVTAYDEYAIRAFEVHAIDYLLKPVDPERLATSLARMRYPERMSPSAGFDPASGTSDRKRLVPDDYVCLERRGRIEFVRVHEIVSIVARKDYTAITSTRTGESLHNASLKSWVERLPNDRFVRVHRSAIVNLDHVLRIDQRPNGTGLVYVRERAEPLQLSRRRARELLHRFR